MTPTEVKAIIDHFLFMRVGTDILEFGILLGIIALSIILTSHYETLSRKIYLWRHPRPADPYRCTCPQCLTKEKK
jgi:hypothetical protein